MKSIYAFILGAILMIGASPAYATVLGWDLSGGVFKPLQNAWTAEVKVSHVTASSSATSTLPTLTTSKAQISTLTSQNCLGTNSSGLIIAGVCGGTSTVYLASSTGYTIGGVAFATGNGTLSTVATGTLTTTATGTQLSATRALTGGPAIFSWSTGYDAVLAASTTQWKGFYDTPSSRITAGTGIDWSGNTLNGVYTAGDALTLTGEDFDFDGGATPAGELGGTWANPTIDDSLAVTSWNLTTPTLTSFFGTPCTGNTFLQDIGDTGTFTCAEATGSGTATTTEWRSTIQGWTFPDALNVNTDIAANNFHTIKPIWYEIDAAGADIGTLDLRTVAGFGAYGYDATNTILIKDNSTEQFVTVSGNDPEIHTFTGSSTLVTTETAELIAFATSTGFTGIELDWEGFSSWTAGETTNYINYVRYLSNEAHKYGLKTMIYLPPIWNSAANSESGSGDEWDSANSDGYYELEYQDFENIPVDYIIIAVYDYQFDYSSGRPNAPLKWQDEIINYAKSKISDHDRLIIGIPAAGYGGTTGGYSFNAYTYEAISAVTGFSGATRDAESGELTWTNGGSSYFISDDESINIKRERAERQGIKRVSLWHIGDNKYGNKYVEPTLTNDPEILTDVSIHGVLGSSILRLFSNAGTKFMEVLNTGVATLLGAWDFGGATSIEIVNGTAPVVDAVGEIAVETTDNQLIFATSTNANAPAVIPTTMRMGAFSISSTSQPFTTGFVTGKSISFPTNRDGYKVTEMYCTAIGGTSVVINFDNGSGNTSTLTCTTAGASLIGVGANSVVTAGATTTAIETGTVTGAVDYLKVSVYGTYLRE